MDIRVPTFLKRHLPLGVFLLSAALELLSYWGWHAPEVRVSVLALLAIGAVVLACLDLRWLFALVMLEAVIGSHGRLFAADVHGFSVSLRMALFAILAVGWGMHAARGCARILHFRHAHVAGPLLLLLAAVTLAIVRGWATGAPFSAIFGDANGYAYVLLIPIGLDLFADRRAFSWLLDALVGAVAWLCAKSLLLLYLFSHAFDAAWLKDVFLWQRRDGLSEITHLSGGAVRVFAASDVLLIPAVVLGLLLGWQAKKRAAWWWTALVAATLLLSLSRSFWLGLAVAVGFLLPVCVRFELMPLRELGRLLLSGATVFLVGAAMLFAITLVPLPKPATDASAWSAYGGRFTDAGDAAVSSRWNMLLPLHDGIAKAPLLGSGFGAQITYRSDDPRMQDLYPGGIVTTGAIEWQYLEIWLKMGLFGLVAVFWLWWRIGLLFWKTIETARSSDRLVALGLMASFLAFIFANLFTPYVNHPLGWVFLMLVIVGFHAVEEHVRPDHHETPRPVRFR